MKLIAQRSERGSALMITLMTCLLIGTVLSSYLGLITNRHRASMRATAWNSAIPVLEAGIEEALTHLQVDRGNPTANQWQPAVAGGQTVYWKHREFPDGSYYYVTNFNVTSAAPVIHSAGYVKSPLKNDEYVSRVVRVSTTNPPSLFSRAIAANGAINLSGGAVVDGYNSALGPYDAVTNRNASGGIATNSRETQPAAINVGPAHVFGSAVTGPGGLVSISGGAVGDVAWNLTSSGIQEGWINSDMNVQFQPNSPPGGTPISPIPTRSGVSNIIYLGTGNYRMTRFISLNETQPMIVTGDATLHVTDELAISGTGYIYIAPDARLRLYFGGRTANISGGGVVNKSGVPSNFSYIGLPSNKELRYSGSANFVGTINAPQADFTLSGNTAVYGAIICNSFTSTGGASVHYDEAAAGQTLFMVTAWREL